MGCCQILKPSCSSFNIMTQITSVVMQAKIIPLNHQSCKPRLCKMCSPTEAGI